MSNTCLLQTVGIATESNQVLYRKSVIASVISSVRPRCRSSKMKRRPENLRSTLACVTGHATATSASCFNSVDEFSCPTVAKVDTLKYHTEVSLSQMFFPKHFRNKGHRSQAFPAEYTCPVWGKSTFAMTFDPALNSQHQFPQHQRLPKEHKCRRAA